MRSLALALLLAACAAPPIPPPPIPAGEEPLRWQAEIEALTAQPAAAAHPIVFVGSSSIRRRDSLARDMAALPVLNRGFGGSRIFDTIYGLDRLVVASDPAIVVVFTGTNDIAGDAPRSGAWVAARFDELVARRRALGCNAPFCFLAITAAPSRERHLAIVQDANARIAARCAQDDRLLFVDTASALLLADGRPDPRWFVADRLHLNAAGYAHRSPRLAAAKPRAAREAKAVGRDG